MRRAVNIAAFLGPRSPVGEGRVRRSLFIKPVVLKRNKCLRVREKKCDSYRCVIFVCLVRDGRVEETRQADPVKAEFP